MHKVRHALVYNGLLLLNSSFLHMRADVRNPIFIIYRKEELVHLVCFYAIWKIHLCGFFC